MTSGVPFGSGPEEAAADAEPTTEQPAVTPPAPAAAQPVAPAGTAATPPVAPAPAPAPAAGPTLAIPGLPLDRPELHVGAAFVGGLLLATVLKRLAR